jgi:hypothetical protein
MVRWSDAQLPAAMSNCPGHYRNRKKNVRRSSIIFSIFEALNHYSDGAGSNIPIMNTNFILKHKQPKETDPAPVEVLNGFAAQRTFESFF